MTRSFRSQVCTIHRRLLSHSMEEVSEKALDRSTIIFSPHPDDEILGCGGTIIRKKQANADVTLVFLTDGSSSHSNMISPGKLKIIRRTEALAASQVLRVEKSKVVFLDFEDGKLSDYKSAASYQVLQILRDHQPCEVFIPYSHDPSLWSTDHVSANRTVRAALQNYDKRVTIYEYPVWLWYHWPWVRLSTDNLLVTLSIIKRTPFSEIRLLKDFHCYVDVGDVLHLKRQALNQYKSQMTRLIPNPFWQTLSDIAAGTFLDCFLQDNEIFHRYLFPSM